WATAAPRYRTTTYSVGRRPLPGQPATRQRLHLAATGAAASATTTTTHFAETCELQGAGASNRRGRKPTDTAGGAHSHPEWAAQTAFARFVGAENTAATICRATEFCARN